VPWERAATYIGSISAVLFVCLLLFAPRSATELSPATNTPVPEAEKSAPSGSSASKEASNANSSGGDFVVSSWNCTIEAGGRFAHIRGELKNASGASVKGLRILATLRTADGTFVSSEGGEPDYDTILAGQTSPFGILIVGLNPAVRTVDLSLENDERVKVEFSGPHSGSCTAENADL
jgi:hypothetical protein